MHVPPSKTDRMTPGLFPVFLDVPPGMALVALQWDFSVPPAIVIAKEDITIGTAAQAARKSLTCAATAKTAGIGVGMRYACILAGGQDPIRSGQIAIVHYRAQRDVQGAPVRVAIERVLGVSANLKRIDVPNASAIINIR